jgi:hypothetical protein
MRTQRLFILALMVLGLPSYALATISTATQVITITTEPFAVIALEGTGGKNSTSLLVDSTGITTAHTCRPFKQAFGIAGGNASAGENQNLKWSTNLKGMRVTVQSNLAADKQHYLLKVRAKNLNSMGSSKGWVVINQEPSSLITDIAGEIGGCSLEYEASSKISEETGCDEHTITYTITE